MKKAILLVILALSFNAFAQIPNNGLVGYWPFNGNTYDESDYGNNAIASNVIPSSNKLGKQNMAFSFSNGFMEVPSKALNNLTTGTISAFININSLNRQHAIIDKTVTGKINYFQFIVDQNNKLRVMLDAGYECSNCVYYSIASIKSNTWYHVAVSWNGVTLKIYINGLLDSSYPCNHLIQNATRSIYIGKVDNNTAFFSGLIDEIRIYNRALGESEIQALNKLELIDKENNQLNSEITIKVKVQDNGGNLIINSVVYFCYLDKFSQKTTDKNGEVTLSALDIPHLIIAYDPNGGYGMKAKKIDQSTSIYTIQLPNAPTNPYHVGNEIDDFIDVACTAYGFYDDYEFIRSATDAIAKGVTGTALPSLGCPGVFSINPIPVVNPDGTLGLKISGVLWDKISHLLKSTIYRDRVFYQYQPSY